MVNPLRLFLHPMFFVIDGCAAMFVGFPFIEERSIEDSQHRHPSFVGR